MFFRHFCFAIFSLLILEIFNSMAQQFDDFDTQDLNFDVQKRTPYFYPQQRYNWNTYITDDDSDEFSRKRRTSSSLNNLQMLGPSQKFQRWRQLVDGEAAKRDSEEQEQEPMVRRRRIPFLYPSRQSYNNYKRYYEVEDEEEAEPNNRNNFVAKRVNPHFYPPNWGMSRRINEMDFKKKRMFPLKKRFLIKKKRNSENDFDFDEEQIDEEKDEKKRNLRRKKKRSGLGETLERDDVTAFGFDKRSLDESLFEEEEERRKKRTKRS